MSDNPLAALAMRERAAEVSDYEASQCGPSYGNGYPQKSAWLIASTIRALPTTFTDAELLAAARLLPEVRALVEAATTVGMITDEDRKPWHDLLAALAPFTKGGDK